METIGYKIRKIREIKGLSQDYVAGKLGVSQNAYSKLERGEVRVDEEKLNTIADILDVNKEIITNYSDQIVFNNCTNSGNFNQYTFHHTIEKIQQVYDKLIIEKDLRLKQYEVILQAKEELIKTLKK